MCNLVNAKKKALAILAGISLMLPLAACGNKAVATTSGGKITESEYYSSRSRLLLVSRCCSR